jgi:hypothetical protein
LATLPAVAADIAAPIAGAVNEHVLTPVADFTRSLFGIKPGQEESPAPVTEQLAEETAPNLPIRPSAAAPQGDFRSKHEAFLATQQPVAMPQGRFTKKAKAVNPLDGIALPQLSGNVNLGDLMKFRLNAINAGVQLLPRVAGAAQRNQQQEQGNKEAALGLKELQLGQDQRFAEQNNLLKLRGQNATIQAARIRAAGAPPTFAESMKDFDAGREFEQTTPVSAADEFGQTVADTSRLLADTYGPEEVFRKTNEIMQQSEGEFGNLDLSEPAQAKIFNTELTRRLNAAHPGRLLPRRPQ